MQNMGKQVLFSFLLYLKYFLFSSYLSMIMNNCVIYVLYGIKIDLTEQNVFMIYNC